MGFATPCRATDMAGQEPSTVLAVRDLKVSIGALHAVRGVSFDVKRGEVFCIVGESGCGKSITAYSLTRVLPASAVLDAESIDLLGHDILGLSEAELSDLRGNRVSMIFQDPMTALNPSYTIGNQLIETMRRHRNVSTSVARKRALELLNKVGVTRPESRLLQYPYELSGGLRQRIVIAMALMCSPDLIIADEPTTALDVTVQAQILKMLLQLRDEGNFSILMITHDMSVVSYIADRIAVMYAGEIVETGTVAQVFGSPRHPYTRGLLQSIPRSGAGKRQELVSIPGTVRPVIGAATGCMFRERCTFAETACVTTAFPLLEEVPGHAFRCRLNEAAPQGLLA